MTFVSVFPFLFPSLAIIPQARLIAHLGTHRSQTLGILSMEQYHYWDDIDTLFFWKLKNYGTHGIGLQICVPCCYRVLFLSNYAASLLLFNLMSLVINISVLLLQNYSHFYPKMKQSKGVMTFEKKPFKSSRIYFIHKAHQDNETYFVKVFNQSIIDKYSLNEAIGFNIEALTESPSFYYPDNFLHILSTQSPDDAVMLLTKTYDYRLDQFITTKGPQPEKAALQIFEQLLKSVYSLVMGGFWHRNLRAQHFVYSDKLWKLQSIVSEQKIGSSGLDCQYLFNTEYKPPQAYDRPNFTEEELDQRIVWDLGCILIHLLLGGHKLKNQVVLQKFKNEPFSFKSLGAKIQQKLSSQLKQLLGRMCHYNQKKRLTLAELISNGFFSREVAQHYAKNKQNKKSTLWVSNSGSVSQNLNLRNSNQKPLLKDEVKKVSEQLLRKSKIEEDLLASSNKGRIDTNEDFHKILQEIAQQDENSLSSIIKRQTKLQKMPSLEEISNLDSEQINQIINLYKNYLDKGQILGIGSRNFQAMTSLFSDKKLGNQLVKLTQYAVNYVKCMDLCQLANKMNQNKPFFKLDQKSWEAFHGSPQYHALKKLVNFNKNVSKKFFDQLRKKLIKQQNRFIKQKNKIQPFVYNFNPQVTSFADIKQPYRKILKLSYDLVADHYTNNKSEQWARLGMYITYCLAIDKFYIPEEFQDNFSFFFTWSKKQPSNYVSLHEFQQYLEAAPRVDLVQYSRFIMKKYYQV